LLVALTFAGCSEPKEAPTTSSAPPVEAARPVHVTAPPLANGTDWGTVFVSLSGGAGDWFVGYQALNSSGTSVEWSADFHVMATNRSGGPVNVFGWAPALVYRFGSDVHIAAAPFNPRLFQHGDGSAKLDYVVRGAASSLFGEGAGFVGVLFAVSADGPWNATVSFTAGSGPRVAPAFQMQGTGATLRFGGDHLADLPTLPVGQTTLDADMLTPGWTHVAVVRASLEPDEVRNYDFRLANGYTHTGPAEGNGYWTPIMASSGSSAIDGFGSVRDVPGKLHAQLTYAETDLGAELAFCHLPLTGPMPDDLGAGNYTTFDWPFPDLPSPVVVAFGPGAMARAPAARAEP